MEDKTLDPAKRREMETDYARADEFSEEELAAVMKKYNVLSPDGKPVSAPFPFNLMFSTSIGPSGDLKGYAISNLIFFTNSNFAIAICALKPLRASS